MGTAIRYEDGLPQFGGEFFLHLVDSQTGEVLADWHHKNVITRDGGVLAAMLFAAGVTGTSGISMLAVGTGATGPLLNPDVADPRQRHLNAEIARKAFSSVTFRTSAGAVSSVPTNVVDFTASFGEGEAVGPLNELSLIRPGIGGAITPVPVFPTYDPTVDLTNFDICINLLNFSVVSKPSTSILTVTWRLTF